MKIHETSWSDCERILAVQGQLSPSSLPYLLNMSGAASEEDGLFGEDLEPLVACGLLERLKTRSRVRVALGGRAAMVILRTADRGTILAGHEPEALVVYIGAEFGPALREVICACGEVGGLTVKELARRASRAEWVEAMLEPGASAKWKNAHARQSTTGRVPPVPHIYTPKVRDHLRALVDGLVSQGGTAPLADLPLLSGAKTRADLDRVYQSAVRFLVIFLEIEPENGQLLMGLSPAVAAGLGRGESEAPIVDQVPMEPTPAYAVLDLQQLIVSVAGGQIRIRSDSVLFKRDGEDLCAALTSLGPAAEGLRAHGREVRLSDALGLAQAFGYVSIGPGTDGRRRLIASEAGRAWLSQSAAGRLDAVIDLAGPLPSPARHEQAGERYRLDWAGPLWLEVMGPADHFFAYGTSYGVVVTAILAELGRLPREGGVDLGAFVQHAGRTRNPLLGQGDHHEELRPAETTWYQFGREELETCWAGLIRRAILRQLAGLGGLRVGLAEGAASKSKPPSDEWSDAEEGMLGAQDDLADPDVRVGLSAMGAYLLGLEERPPVAAESPAKIVLQGNFDVVFLDSNPSAEAELATFCTRVGSGVGVLFQVTKEGIMGAAAAGVTLDSILESLQRTCRSDMPANVATEIRTWHGRQRTVVLQQAWILQCGDADTASRVLAAGRGKLERLGDETVAVRPPTTPKTIANLLAKHGIAIDTSEVPEPKKKTARRRRRRSYWR